MDRYFRMSDTRSASLEPPDIQIIVIILSAVLTLVSAARRHTLPPPPTSTTTTIVVEVCSIIGRRRARRAWCSRPEATTAATSRTEPQCVFVAAYFPHTPHGVHTDEISDGEEEI